MENQRWTGKALRRTKVGLGAESETFNAGKDGFLERQDFLERTVLCQFERESDKRQA